MDGNSCYNEYSGMSAEEIARIPHFEFDTPETCRAYWQSTISSEEILHDMWKVTKSVMGSFIDIKEPHYVPKFKVAKAKEKHHYIISRNNNRY